MNNANAKKIGQILFLGIISLFSFNAFSQVGIGTVNPNGLLDVQSTTQGVVLPRVALTDTYLMAPATNPQMGIIPAGTVVYNTNVTNHGNTLVSEDVSKGIYVWNGTKWVPQFTRKQYALYEQRDINGNINIRTQSNEGFRTIDGLNAQTFTANYTGTYRIEVNVNYGSGQVKVIGNREINTALQSGVFRVSIDGGTNYKDIPAGSYGNAYKAGNGNGRSEGNYFGIWKQYTLVYKVPLTKGDVLNLRLAFDQNNAPEFDNNGNENNADNTFLGGDGHVGFDIPCTIEISFMD